MVTWFHMTNTYSEESWVRASGTFGYLGVEIFFVISGFIIPWSMNRAGYTIRTGFGSFLTKRVLRIEPPYLLSVLFALLLLWAGSKAPGFKGAAPDFSLAQIASHAGYLTGILNYTWLNVVYWTLAIEFQFYIAVAISFVVWRSAHPLMFCAIVAGLSGLAQIFYSPVYVLYYWSLFSLGIIAFRSQCKVDTPLWTGVCLCVTSVMLYLQQGLAISLAGLFAVAAILFAPRLLASAPLRAFGAISFSLYLVHVPVGGRVINLGRRLGDTDMLQFACSLTGLFASIVVAWAFWRIIERPAVRWSSRIQIPRGSS